ncbi:MAG: hypothetical protein A3J74_10280 [Elusimicrobia bacterium RIFCSPHIGHO2_02_FULL_57_9]|nr:MAG: hypothetical protein A3J74_10280 [Elusimicrobia bacterium RIFCSPHIGHO2_02_FULL_57_9]
MPKNKAVPLAIFLLAVPIGIAIGTEEEPKPQRYSPPTRSFYCDIPAGWHPFEEEDSLGNVVHILGPDSPSGNYRTGIDIRRAEKNQPDYLPIAKVIEDLRRTDPYTGRTATGVRPMRISGILSRTFEIVENRRLPAGHLPSFSEELHHYVAVIPSGASYFIIRLSSTRDIYLDYRKLFIDFLRSFKPA